MKYLKVLVDLDAIMDTRLGTISQIDDAAAIKCFESEEYYFRLKDDFTDICGIGMAQFREAYANRNLDTIKRSVVCPTAFILKEMIISLELAQAQHPLAGVPAVDLNIWPYQLDQQTQQFLAAAVGNYAGMESPIRCVSFSPEQLSFKLMKEHYGAYLVYGFRDWVKYPLESKEFEKTTIPRVSVVAPALFETDLPTPSEYEQQGLNPDIDPIEMTEVMFRPMVGLDMAPAFMFSIYRADKHQEWMSRTYREVQSEGPINPALLEEARLRQAEIARQKA